MKKALARFAAKRRLKPYHLALCVLFVGWTPSLLLAYYSYNVLSRTLEAKMMTDAHSLVRSLSQHVQHEIDRARDTVDYYCTFPATMAALQTPAAPPVTTPPPPPIAPALPALGNGGGNVSRRPPRALPPGQTPVAVPAAPVGAAGNPSPQDWLTSIYFPQKRDGMFLTDAAGWLVAFMPQPNSGRQTPRDFFATTPWWKEAATFRGYQEMGYYCSPVYERPADGRLVASVLMAVRKKDDADRGVTIGYVGVDLLIERIGNRLRAVGLESGRESTLRIIDQNNLSLLQPDLSSPSALGQSGIDPALVQRFREDRRGETETGGKIYIYAPIGDSGWLVVLEKSSELAHQPVQNFLRQTLLLAGWLLVGTAITAYLLSGFYRRQLQSSLRIEREQVFNEKILANMPVGIALIDPRDERFLQANSAFVEIARSLGGLKRHTELSQLTFADLPIATREALARVLHFGVPYQAIEQRTPTANGQTRYLTTNLLRLQDSFQRTLGVLCLVEDGTPAVNLRQELINANAAKDQFLAQLSHELRNPLSPVITMVAELEAVAQALPDARQPLEIIRRNVELEARLIDDLLDVTRISSGKLQLSREDVDLHRVIRLALEICQRDIDDKQLTIRLELRAREHWVRADPARLQQVFWNLIKNSVKFTPAGRRITIRSADSEWRAADSDGGKTHVSFVGKPATDGHWSDGFGAGNGAHSNGGQDRAASEEASAPENGAVNGKRGAAGNGVRVEVTDEGIGIEPQNLARIFNAFDQGQSSITRRFGGLGLGLAISKAMVEAHGGTLTAGSEGLGHGATFAVEMAAIPAPEPPAADASNRRKPPAAADPAAQSTLIEGCRVLLVDDHEDTCFGMKRLLTRRGYQVTTAHSVNQGLMCAEREAFDLLISDIGLPDGTGFDLMNALRQRGGPPGIALSGFGMESDIGKSREAGFSEHLIKPVDVERLDAAMRELLKRQRVEGRR